MRRLEAGVFKLPRVGEGKHSLELRASELAIVLDGIDMSKLKRVLRYQHASKTRAEKVRFASV
jgi:transposase